MGSPFDLSRPLLLALLLGVVGLAAGYVWAQRRRHQRAITFANTAALDRIAPRRRRLTHLPMALGLVALTLLTIAAAGPQGEHTVPRNRATVILVLDVSLSMRATDVSPSRLDAAKQAASRFADQLTPGINLGLVTYAGKATPLVNPTPDRDQFKRALEGLTVDEKTATGEGIIVALNILEAVSALLGGDGAPPAHIVLESDGKETEPTNPDNPRGGYWAARLAKQKGIPVSTIAFGTRSGVLTTDDGQAIPVPVDEPSLAEIARLSGGEAFTASSLDQLNRVYDRLQEKIGMEVLRGEEPLWWIVGGVLLIVAAFGTAIVVNQRLP